MGSMSVSTCLGHGILLLMFAGFSCGNFPLLDVDTNMRIVLVPFDTKVGTIIYRLRASDSDNNFPLAFEVLGALGKSLLTLKFLGCSETESLCQADVVLNKALVLDRSYEFQLQVKDTTGDYTKVQAVITATSGSANAANSFFGPTILHVPENTPIGTEMEKFVVVKNELNSRTVLLEMRDPNGRIELKQKLLSNNRTEGTLLLAKKLDFETVPWFTFQLLAMNAHTNNSVDTRNILLSEVIVAVHDVQDTPPSFTLLPSIVEIPSSIQPGDLVASVAAEDGDKQNKRLIRYGFLTDANPFVVFFDLNPMSGEIHLRRNISELLAMAKPNEPIRMTIIAEEILTESSRLGRSTPASLDRAMANITFWFGRGSSIGPPTFSSTKYVAEVKENSVFGTPLQFSTQPRVWHQNPDEIIVLSFSSTGSGSSNSMQATTAFEILPSHGTGNFSFEIRVVDSKFLDFETMQIIKLKLMGSTNSGMSVYSELLIVLKDENDASPIFTQPEYHVELLENSPKGTKVLQVKAIDKDTAGNFGQVTYSNLVGSNAFRLDPITGDIIVDQPELLDRDVEPEIRLYIEAKDGGYTEFSDPSVVRNIATTTVVVKLQDINDNAPEFNQKFYQAVLTPDLNAFKTPIYLKAYDMDEGTNGQVRYQVNDNKFYIDQITGELRLRVPYPRNQGDGDGPFLGVVKVKAHDLGSPPQSTETIVQLFAEEMVSREIQFIFPQSPEKIRKNQTSIEKMLSSLTGGIVGIQKVTPFGRSLSLSQTKEPLEVTSSTDPSSLPVKAHEEERPAGLSYASDKSLVTATVQYPVSATPSRVDLAAWQKAYMSAQEPSTNSNNSSPLNSNSNSNSNNHDTKVLEVYKAENRVLFWILIAFLVLLLMLFTIFLCCIYCPCCWLYGYCYRRSAKIREYSGHREERVIEKRPIARRSRKTYPSEEEVDYDHETGGYRKEAWSGDDNKYWRGNHPLVSNRRYPTPHHRALVRKTTIHNNVHGGVEGDVALEDWEFEPQRHNDRADEIGPRWQQMQQQQQQPQPQQQIQQQQQIQLQPRRVGYAGHPHPGDESFIRRHDIEPGGNTFNYVTAEMERTQLPRNYPQRSGIQSIPPADSRAQSHFRPRQTRFFRTETGEVLQFGDFEGDDGKEMLMERFMDDQQPQQNEQFQQYGAGEQGYERRGDTPAVAIATNGPPRRAAQGPEISSDGRTKSFVTDSLAYLADQQIPAATERPKAAVVSRRPQRGIAVKEIPEADEDENEEDIPISTTIPKTKLVRQTHYETEDGGVDYSRRHHRRDKHKTRLSRSESDDESVKATRSKRNSKSKSKSVSRSRSKSPPAIMSKSNSKSQSRSRSRSQSVDNKNAKNKVKSRATKDHRKKTREERSRYIKQQERTEKDKTTSRRSKGMPMRQENVEKAVAGAEMFGLDSSPIDTPPDPPVVVTVDETTTPGTEVTVINLETMQQHENQQGTNVAINIISPSSAKTDSSYNGKEISPGDTPESPKTRRSNSRSSQTYQNYHHEEQHSSVVQNQNEVSHQVTTHEEDEDSGIGIIGIAPKRNRMLEKKSVFTIAYDEMAQNVLRPDTPTNMEVESEMRI